MTTFIARGLRALSDPFYHYCSWLCACLILAKLLLEVILVHTDGYSCSIARPQMLSCDHFYCKRPRALSDPFYHYYSWLCACLILAKLLLEVILVHTDGYSCSIARPQMLSCDHFYCKRPRALCYLFYHHCLKHQLQIHWLKGAYLYLHLYVQAVTN